MKESPYEHFAERELILRDQLAIDRTNLANERTLLAYLRSGVALLIAGASILQFAEAVWFRGVGVACIPLGIAATLVGVLRFWSVYRRIARIRQARQASKGDGSGDAER